MLADSSCNGRSSWTEDLDLDLDFVGPKIGIGFSSPPFSFPISRLTCSLYSPVRSVDCSSEHVGVRSRLITVPFRWLNSSLSRPDLNWPIRLFVVYGANSIQSYANILRPPRFQLGAQQQQQQQHSTAQQRYRSRVYRVPIRNQATPPHLRLHRHPQSTVQPLLERSSR